MLVVEQNLPLASLRALQLIEGEQLPKSFCLRLSDHPTETESMDPHSNESSQILDVQREMNFLGKEGRGLPKEKQKGGGET